MTLTANALTPSPGAVVTFPDGATLNGTNFIRISKNGGSPVTDQIVLTGGTLAYGGTLVISNVGGCPPRYTTKDAVVRRFTGAAPEGLQGG